MLDITVNFISSWIPGFIIRNKSNLGQIKPANVNYNNTEKWVVFVEFLLTSRLRTLGSTWALLKGSSILKDLQTVLNNLLQNMLNIEYDTLSFNDRDLLSWQTDHPWMSLYRCHLQHLKKEYSARFLQEKCPQKLQVGAALYFLMEKISKNPISKCPVLKWAIKC